MNELELKNKEVIEKLDRKQLLSLLAYAAESILTDTLIESWATDDSHKDGTSGIAVGVRIRGAQWLRNKLKEFKR